MSNPRRARTAFTVAVLALSTAVLVAGLILVRHEGGRAASVTRSPSARSLASAEASTETSPRASAEASPGASDSGAPTAARPSTVARSTAGRPRLLTVASVGIKLPVVAVGVATDGQMALPPDPANIGWYRYGPAPGARHGSAVLAGHVDSLEYGVGQLSRLSSVRVGAAVDIASTRGRARFVVRSVRLVPKSDVALAEVFRRTGRRLLRIVTCGGAYIRSAGGYQDNVIVTATPVRP